MLVLGVYIPIRGLINSFIRELKEYCISWNIYSCGYVDNYFSDTRIAVLLLFCSGNTYSDKGI